MAISASSLAVHDTGKLFEPDAILTVQYYSMFKSSQYRDPERRLMVAILEDAVSCLSMNLRRCNVRKRKQYEAAQQWVTTEEDSEWIFSFRNICEVLGMDPSYLRRGLTLQATGNLSASKNAITSTRRHPGNLRSASRQKKIRIRASF
jgi:hypothetical protein